MITFRGLISKSFSSYLEDEVIKFSDQFITIYFRSIQMGKISCKCASLLSNHRGTCGYTKMPSNRGTSKCFILITFLTCLTTHPVIFKHPWCHPIMEPKRASCTSLLIFYILLHISCHLISVKYVTRHGDYFCQITGPLGEGDIFESRRSWT